MANPKIYIRRSATPNKVPTSDQLALGELAINTNDGKLYLEKDPNGVGIGTTVVCVNPFNVGVGSLSYDINFTAGDVGIGTDDVSTAVGSNNTAVLAAGIVTAYNLYGGGLSLTDLGSENEILIVGSGQTVTSTSVLTIDNSSKYVGINQTSPDVTLHMTGEGAQTAQIRMEQYNDSADAPDVRIYRRRGTIASPADVQTGDYLFRLNVHGRDAGSDPIYHSLQMDVDSSDQDAGIVNLRTRDKDGTEADRFGINKDGAIVFNGAYTFPTADGSNGQALITDGSGNVSFGTPAAGPQGAQGVQGATGPTGPTGPAGSGGSGGGGITIQDSGSAIGTGIGTVNFGRNLTVSALSVGIVTVTCIPVEIHSNAPTNANHGDLWFDQDEGELYVYYDDGSGAQWVEASGGSDLVTISDSAPPNPNAGDLWWESDTGRLKIYYNDGDSNQWIDAVGGIADGLGGRFLETNAGIHTLSSVGIGTTNPAAVVTSANTAVLAAGIVTAYKFYGDGSGLTGISGGGGGTGPQGAQGVQGAAGSTGPQGAQGVQGAAGSTGPQGAQGVQGATGSAGAQGAQGVQGASGSNGSTGPQGAQGVQGATGSTGPQGVQGATGAGSPGGTGPQGVQGAAGSTGPQGVQGATGSAGPQGAQGVQGAQGSSFSRSESNFTATANQTTFSVSYTNGDDLDVFVNGVRLTPAEYTASNGSTVVLDTGATVGDIVDILYFESAGPQGAQGVQGATGPQGAAGSGGGSGVTTGKAIAMAMIFG